MKYVTWTYESGAPAPYYHIFTLDLEPGGLDLPPTLFTITTAETPEMDAKIEALCAAMDAVIEAALPPG